MINYLLDNLKFNILSADDEVENLRAFELVFRWEYNIYTMASPSNAYVYLIDHKAYLLTTDQRMPEITGVGLLDKVFDFKPDLRSYRMILTGYSNIKAI